MRGSVSTFFFIASLFTCALLNSQSGDPAHLAVDTDRDGLSDSLEARLLAAFIPTFMVSSTDCSIMPAQFERESSKPTVVADDGTIYGHAFPRKGDPREIELHYYHLWRKDCGELGHSLDAEHVSAIVQLGGDADSATALYWYASAHEDTICDASHLTRAKTIDAESRGATVWISEGKHASFFSEDLCRHGCGGDHCDHMEPLTIHSIVNLGEAAAPMNGIAWLQSPDWPLKDKMSRSDFTDVRLMRLNGAPATAVIWANPPKRPAQAAVLGFNAGVGGAAIGARAANSALVLTNDSTSSALETGSNKTESALSKSSRNVWKTLKSSTKKAGKFLHLTQ